MTFCSRKITLCTWFHFYIAHAVIQEKEQLQQRDYQQPGKDQAPAGPPQNANVYNIELHKFDKNNKMNAQMNAHSVAVSMQGPGSIELDTSQTQVAPGEQRPDHTVSVIKDTEHTPAVNVMSVKNTGKVGGRSEDGNSKKNTS